MSIDHRQYFSHITENDTRVSILVSVFLLGLLSVETIPLPIPVYIAPATSLVALTIVPLIYWRSVGDKQSPLTYALALVYGYALAHSVGFLLLDYLTVADGLLRAKLWVEQLIALSAGLAVFGVLRITLRTLSSKDRSAAILVGSCLSIIPAVSTVLWMVTSHPVFLELPRMAREFAPTGFDSFGRVTGLASEPSHFAFLIVTVLIPAVMIGYPHPDETTRPRLRWFVMGCLLVGLVFATLSTTGMLLLVVFVGAFTLISGRWKLSAIGVIMVSLGIGGFIMLFPDTYLARQMLNLVTGGWQTSINTRFYSTIGPITTAFESIHGFVGYGLGGTAYHADKLLPKTAISGLAHNSGSTLNLKTLVGRIIAELGIPGLLAFGGVFTVAYVQFVRFRTHTFFPWRWTLEHRVIAAALITAVFGHGIGNASFAIPVVWLWLAWIDVDSYPVR